MNDLRPPPLKNQGESNMNMTGITLNVSLHSLVQRLPATLTAGEFDALVGDKTEFTEEEAAKIVDEALSMKEPEPVMAVEPTYKPFVAPITCRALVGRRTCHTALPEGNVSGFCENCWYPDIEDDYAHYRDLREEGYGRDQAAVMVGILDQEEQISTKSNRRY